MLKTGDRIAEFSLTASDGRTVSAAGLRGRRYVLFFYPKDNTPGCTTEACAFRDEISGFEQLAVSVFGVSADNDLSHRKFAAKYALNFPLLADPTLGLLKACGAWIEKSMYGLRFMGVMRSTMLIGTDGRIETVWAKVSPASHAQEVLAYLHGAAAPVLRRVIRPPIARAKKGRGAGKQIKTSAAAKKNTAARKQVAKKPAAAKKSTKRATTVKSMPSRTADRKSARKAIARH